MEDYMLPCLNKKLFGIDCLGCGMQRATVLLFRGEFAEAFRMYPAIYTLILLAVFLLINLRFQIPHAKLIKTSLIVINVLIIVVSYFYKMHSVH